MKTIFGFILGLSMMSSFAYGFDYYTLDFEIVQYYGANPKEATTTPALPFSQLCTSTDPYASFKCSMPYHGVVDHTETDLQATHCTPQSLTFAAQECVCVEPKWGSCDGELGGSQSCIIGQTEKPALVSGIEVSKVVLKGRNHSGFIYSFYRLANCKDPIASMK